MGTGCQLYLALKFLTLGVFVQTEDFDNSNTDGHMDCLPPVIGLDELRSRKMFYSLNPGA